MHPKQFREIKRLLRVTSLEGRRRNNSSQRLKFTDLNHMTTSELLFLVYTTLSTIQKSPNLDQNQMYSLHNVSELVAQ